MTAREKANWLKKANPYKQQGLAEAWVEGARTFWKGLSPDVDSMNTRLLSAFWKGYDAAERGA